MLELNNSLDDILGGGIPSRTITQLYGPSASGKTNICLHATIRCAESGGKVFFVDPEGSFCEARLRQMLGKNFDKVIKNISVYEPSTLEDQGKAISLVEKEKNVDLVVVDSIVYLYRLALDRENPYEQNKELSLQMAMLLDIARKKDSAVIVTNQVYTNIDKNSVEPVAGDTMKYSSKVILALEHNSQRKATLIRHLFKREGLTTNFRIVDEGVI